MTDTTDRATPPRKHHRLRWILLGAAAALVLLAIAAVTIGTPAPARATPALPATSATPTGPLEGTWNIATGSMAGFRVRETFLGMSDDTVGETDAVTGSVAVAHDQLTTATIHVDLAATTVRGQPAPQFVTSLDTQRYPTATVTLGQPIVLGAAFASGATVTATTTVLLTMHGATHPGTITLSARRDRDTLQAAGSIPVTFSEWGIAGPAGYGAAGSLADHGTAEFLLVARRA